MTGVDLGEHDPALRLGHRVTLEARKRGAIIRPLGDVIVLMPPLAISAADLQRLVEITAESIRAACADVYGDAGAERTATAADAEPEGPPETGGDEVEHRRSRRGPDVPLRRAA
jgi:hypothetical protein